MDDVKAPPKETAEERRARRRRRESAVGKRERRLNPAYADFDVEPQIAHALAPAAAASQQLPPPPPPPHPASSSSSSSSHPKQQQQQQQKQQDSDFEPTTASPPPPKAPKQQQQQQQTTTTTKTTTDAEDEEEALRRCDGLLKALAGLPEGAAFRAPVDVVGLGIAAEYARVVQHPMDLGTVRARLAARAYKCVAEAADDARLALANAMLFNPRGHPVHEHAAALCAALDRHVHACGELRTTMPNAGQLAGEVRRTLATRAAAQLAEAAAGRSVAFADDGLGARRAELAAQIAALKGFAVGRVVDALLRAAPHHQRRALLAAAMPAVAAAVASQQHHAGVVEIDLDQMDGAALAAVAAEVAAQTSDETVRMCEDPSTEDS